MHCRDGRLTSAEISRALSRILDTPEVAFPEMLGSSPAMRHLLQLAARVANNDAPVLICGETGTGKEAVARWIHARSGRSQGPFETFDGALLDPAASASELFGHERGAFPWAAQPRRGLLAAANQGTLFVREVGDLDRALQSKLSRLLDHPSAGFERLGGQESQNADVRLIAGSCRPLGDRLGAEFSRELYHQLRQNYLETPPLRSRLADIPELAAHFIARHQGASDGILKWEPRALSACQRYQWPGNLNELDEVLAEVLLRTDPGGEITLDHFPARIRNASEKAHPIVTPPPGGDHEGDTRDPWPNTGDVVDGYRLLPRVISTTAGARVFLAEDLALVLRIAKFSNARNEYQLDAVKKIMALRGKEPEARNFMIPIYHANARAADKWCMIVLDCLDDVSTGRDISGGLYQPHTFAWWITRRHNIPSPSSYDRLAAINHLEAVLRALDFFHRRELIMNDAKPENFGFFEGRLVIIDCGGFAFRDQPPHESTLFYGPPEVRVGKPADDIYAVVVMMAEALYNTPLEELTPERVPLVKEYHIREGTLFDKCAWALIETGLHVFPGMRFQDAASLIRQLEELKRLLGDETQE
jgi:DNA-binding transcriptional MerR regulator